MAHTHTESLPSAIYYPGRGVIRTRPGNLHSTVVVGLFRARPKRKVGRVSLGYIHVYNVVLIWSWSLGQIFMRPTLDLPRVETPLWDVPFVEQTTADSSLQAVRVWGRAAVRAGQCGPRAEGIFGDGLDGAKSVKLDFV